MEDQTRYLCVGGPLAGTFRSCDANSCVVVVREGTPDAIQYELKDLFEHVDGKLHTRRVLVYEELLGWDHLIWGGLRRALVKVFMREGCVVGE